MNIKKYKNKNISILGDSISTFEGVSIPKEASYYDMERKLLSGVTSVSATWWGQVIEKLGAKLLVNNSISGSTVTWHPSYEVESYGCSDERTASLSVGNIKPDVIIVYLGTNDWGGGVKLSNNELIQSNDLTIFSIAYSKMLEKLKSNYPNAEIWCFTLATSYCSAKSYFKFPYYSDGWHIYEYCKTIKKCAEEKGCKVIDLYNNMKPYDTIDGFHPNSEGMNTIAEAVIKLI